MEEWDYVYKIECIHKQSLINQGLEFCDINIDVSLCYSCTMKQFKEIKCIEKLGTEEREKTKLKAMTEEQREHISSVILGDVTTMRCDESVIYIDDFISYGQMAEIVDYLRKEEQQ